MGEAGVTEEFFARRAAARARLDEIDPHKRPGGVEADPQRKDWFEAVYRLAEGDAAGVPWAHLAPHPLLADWLATRRLDGLRALDVGCGLGDNAEALAAAGANVTAFDLVGDAVAWAKRRFPQSDVDYRAADLFAAPEEWRGGFDLVHECYTLQALPDTLLDRAAEALAGLVAPGGLLLVIARARDEGQEVGGPPWPLPPSRMEALAVGGLRCETLEDISATNAMVRHWRAAFRRDG
ncbi:bifunctional 2-polyprenyl-6-hydroxyphenol methylase/3-demethylubiquinol 3-O-methyltransferase UbiG [Methylosinus sp. RM1]|uniref:class I SAM-dependent methyltransferase n=1 Tax=Methylosinus sp. RM1 TaxID=2583817 RepID=UPI00140AE3E7|nr:class I SAM-dependent methyltransferase [Methylosinus sp. RM1]